MNTIHEHDQLAPKWTEVKTNIMRKLTFSFKYITFRHTNTIK